MGNSDNIPILLRLANFTMWVLTRVANMERQENKTKEMVSFLSSAGTAEPDFGRL